MIEINEIDQIYLMLAKASVGNITKEFLSISFSYTDSKLVIRFNLIESDKVPSESIEDVIVDFEVQIASLKSYSRLGKDLDTKWKIDVMKTKITQVENLENIVYLKS